MASEKDRKEPAHVVVDKDMTARINIGILVSIIASTVLGALYLQDIQYQVASANNTLTKLERELSKQNESLRMTSVTLIRVEGRVDALTKRVDALEARQ